MQLYPHTWDGKAITATVSNWSEFSTADSKATTPPVALTVQSVLAQIHALRQILTQPKLNKALRDLYNHIDDTNNPHHTDLDQFSQQVVDVLYKEYQKVGGTGSLDFYLQSLFYTLRVATIEEMENSSNENLLVSILGANRIIEAHENDTNAHHELFDQWFPGEPISADPVEVIMGSFGVLPNYLYKKNDGESLNDDMQIAGIPQEVGNYSRINNHGTLVYEAINNGVNGDWGLDQALLPCFGDHTNKLINSIRIGEDLFTRENIGYRENDALAPDTSVGVTEIYTRADESAVEHNIVIQGFEAAIGTTQTISLFVKPIACQCFALRFVDMVATNLEVQAIYNFSEESVIVMNSLGRYSAELFKLANGWYRCCFTIYHHLGQKADLRGTFFNITSSDVLSSFSFQAEDNTTLAYIWGAQLEDTPNATGYIPTESEPVTEKGFYYCIDIANKLDINNMSLHIQFRNPKTWGRDSIIRPIFTIVDDQWRPIWSCRMKNTGEIVIERIDYRLIETTDIALIDFYDKLNASSDNWGQLAISIGSDAIHTRYNQNTGLDLVPPSASRAGYKLLIGCDENANTFCGFIRCAALYKKSSTPAELEFLVGEIIHD